MPPAPLTASDLDIRTGTRPKLGEVALFLTGYEARHYPFRSAGCV